jgi:hypothetical protein
MKRLKLAPFGSGAAFQQNAGNPWIAQRLAMGHSGSVSRLVVACGKSVTQTRELEELKKMLECDTDPICVYGGLRGGRVGVKRNAEGAEGAEVFAEEGWGRCA